MIGAWPAVGPGASRFPGDLRGPLSSALADSYRAAALTRRAQIGDSTVAGEMDDRRLLLQKREVPAVTRW
jgi:hypothetical protein